jgi:predicted nucleic acid-binding protein
MIPGFVADASVAVSWVAESQRSEATEQLKAAVLAGTGIVVPALWRWEIANALLHLFERRRLTRSEWEQARRLILKVPVDIDEESAARALDQTSGIATQLRLTAYDAAYIETARRRGLPLASRDAALNKAARKHGVRTLL